MAVHHPALCVVQPSRQKTQPLPYKMVTMRGARHGSFRSFNIDIIHYEVRVQGRTLYVAEHHDSYRSENSVVRGARPSRLVSPMLLVWNSAPSPNWGGYKRWTFSDSMDKRARVVTLPSVVSAVCIAQNLYLEDSLLIV